LKFGYYFLNADIPELDGPSPDIERNIMILIIGGMGCIGRCSTWSDAGDAPRWH
jgi:hypothetical protein